MAPDHANIPDVAVTGSEHSMYVIFHCECCLCLWMKSVTTWWHTQCVKWLKLIFVWFDHNWLVLTSKPWLSAIGWLSVIYRLVIRWLLTIYWLSISWLLAGYRLAINWLLASYQLAISWLSSINRLAMCWPWAGHGLAISSPPFNTMTIVFEYWIVFCQYH